MGQLGPFHEAARRFAGRPVQFVLCYTREAHPGERVPAHASFAQKLRQAQACREQEGITLPLLVDGLEGEVHRAYGSLPNMAYVIDPEGRIVYRADWADAREIEQVLEDLLSAAGRAPRQKRAWSERLHIVDEDQAIRRRVFERAGEQAQRDFARTQGRPAFL